MPNKNTLANGLIALGRTLGLAAGLVLALSAAPALADQIDFAHPAFAPTGGATSIPVGASEFCKVHRADCSLNNHAVAAMPLSSALWQELVDINNLVNAAIQPVTDIEYYQLAEYWTYPDQYGDCEDYALAKRKLLIERGWHPSTLLMTVVRETDGAGHAVLMVRTDRGDLVLDNQRGDILLWNQTPYQYLKRQSQADAGRWVDIVDQRETLVAAAR